MAAGRLAGRRALVTGGGRGIGRATALCLAREGADVAVAARSAAQTGEAAAEIRSLGVLGFALDVDVTDAASVSRMAAQATETMGGVDILINGAGDAESNPLARTDESLWQRMIAVNLTSVFLCTRQLVGGMRERGWGRIVNVASRAGLVGYAYVSAYVAAKHGVVGFTRAVAIELAGSGVTVNAICPGQVDTEMTRRAARDIAARTGRPIEQVMEQLAELNPSRRMVTADEVAEAALRLALPESEAITGQAVEV
ncbi:MAG: SDR family NAD(P)-dependent oxidoreductase [Candidatus Polarisedimenticolia bacterium]